MQALDGARFLALLRPVAPCYALVLLMWIATVRDVGNISDLFNSIILSLITSTSHLGCYEAFDKYLGS